MSRPHFVDDQRIAGRRVWQKSSAGALGSGLCALFLGSVTVFIFVGVASSLITKGVGHKSDWLAILGIICCMAFMAMLTAYLWRDALGKRGMSIVLTPSQLILSLPLYRSLIHKPPACWESVPFADVTAIETRLEVYKAMVQRAYRLVRRDKPAIFLFEDRAVGTDLASSSMWAVAEEIAQRIGVGVTDLGTVEGRLGMLGVAFAAAPAWSTPKVSEARQGVLLRRSILFGGLVTLLTMLVWLVHLL